MTLSCMTEQDTTLAQNLDAMAGHRRSPAYTKPKEEHDKGIQIPEGGSVVGRKALQQETRQGQGQQHTDLGGQDSA